MVIWFYRIIFIVAVPAAIYYAFSFTHKQAAFVFVIAALFVILEIVLRKIFAKNGKKSAFVLDASALSDGRIFSIAKTNLLTAVFIIPKFVIDDLKLISNSSDPVKRNRAKRGLDIAAKLQSTDSITTKGFYKDYKTTFDTNEKMLRTAKALKATLITANFNLTKSAASNKIPVLNINDLSESFTKLYLPGETITIFLVKEGAQEGQAVGYLDDGTMVVAEDGKKYVGKRVALALSSVIQTSTGRMIFGRVETETTERQAPHQPAANNNNNKKPFKYFRHHNKDRRDRK